MSRFLVDASKLVAYIWHQWWKSYFNLSGALSRGFGEQLKPTKTQLCLCHAITLILATRKVHHMGIWNTHCSIQDALIIVTIYSLWGFLWMTSSQEHINESVLFWLAKVKEFWNGFCFNYCLQTGKCLSQNSTRVYLPNCESLILKHLTISLDLMLRRAFPKCSM